MMDADATSRLLHTVLPKIKKPTLVLDAAPLACLGDAPELLHSLNDNVIVTPHSGEMAAMLGARKKRSKPTRKPPRGRPPVNSKPWSL